MKFFISGGAGFIGSHFVDYLLSKKHKVIVYDDLSLGKKENISKHFKNKSFKFIKGNILNLKKLSSHMKGSNAVIHLAANSDIVKSSQNPKIELKNGTIATYNILEAMKKNNLKEILFTSSSVVYGEVKKLPIKENYGPLFPISFYGSSKFGWNSSDINTFRNTQRDRVTLGIPIDGAEI